MSSCQLIIQDHVTLRIIGRKRQKSAGDDRSTLTLKLMGRVIRSPKQRVPVAPQKNLGPTKTLKKTLNVRIIILMLTQAISMI